MAGEHKGHRQRMKERFLKEGLDSFDAHQIIELILFNTIPRKDTNILAHHLLDRFGTLPGVLDARVEELMEVEGITKNMAAGIKLFPAVFSRYDMDKRAPCFCFDTLDKVGDYVRSLFVGVTVEQVYMLSFDNRLKLLDCAKLTQGSVNSAPISPRQVTERAYDQHASSVVLVHNHPNGTVLPSKEDIKLTDTMETACGLVGITLLEHLVVAGYDYFPIMRSQKGISRLSPITKLPDEEFYRKYYEGK